MSQKRLQFVAMVALGAGLALQAWAGNVVKITIPRHSELTPVQRLNREGVEAVSKKDYERASQLFMKAYLYDPADPFTLNNLGYIAELQGQLERAQTFYTLASEQGSTADIDRSNAKQLVGKPMQMAFQGLGDGPMRVNRMNVDAMNLLAQDRGFEAVTLLKKTLAMDQNNPFTLNNLGVAEEAVGDYDSAVNYYSLAAATGSKEAVVVTEDRTWRGKPVSNMAAESALRLRQRLSKTETATQQAEKYTLMGVNASNRNDFTQARQDFLQAYALDPNNAFSLNNRGYVAEMEGDLETAQFFYEKAQRAGDARTRVGLATQQGAEGKPLASVASDSDSQVDKSLAIYSEERRRQTGPIELTPRTNQAPGQPAPH